MGNCDVDGFHCIKSAGTAAQYLAAQASEGRTPKTLLSVKGTFMLSTRTDISYNTALNNWESFPTPFTVALALRIMYIQSRF